MTSGSHPQLLEDHVADGMVARRGLVAFPHHWQVPAATEKAAFAAMSVRGEAGDFVYVGFPWATVIDGLRNDAPQTWDLLRNLAALRARLEGEGRRRATVAQHINADKFVDLFKALGVTDLFWSHARVGQAEIDGIALHPFPLFPAQTPDGREAGDPHRARRYVANFIGAYNPRVYLTDVREQIFADRDAAPDLLIVRREAWHFDRAVYSEQMKGVPADAARLRLEAAHKAEYLQAMRDSLFTLCPSGSGPNSIRIYEALAVGSIPIILTRELGLAGDPALWERTCLIAEDSVRGYRDALARARAMSVAEVRDRQRALAALFAMVGPQGYGDLIADAMADGAPAGRASMASREKG
ncbi:exostosin domain-containing protein [Aquabacter spiritensis]|uniref:Exostosin family protein n=1 Tax=Aquabacter spiritensis TaxID=933073 RepID=A0A4R3LVD2_9HYPH|nr:exostosin family protein [Aquabacter spiritensis]TCT04006.1 exostosin family protein [Aquabacter spiritensis]